MQNSEIKEKSNLSISEKREIIDRIKKGLNNELIIDEFNKRNFTINNKIVDKIRGEIEPDDAPIANLKANSAPKIADALMKKFQEDQENLKKGFMKYLQNESLLNTKTPEQIQQIFENKDRDSLINLLKELSLKDLIMIDTDVSKTINEQEIKELNPDHKQFFKVVIKAGKPEITPLKSDEIYGENGIDKSKEFVIINPGNGPACSSDQAIDRDSFIEALPYEAKLFQKGNPDLEIQYLVAINATKGPSNMDEIKAYNQTPTMASKRAQEQVEKIYGPLLKDDDGNLLSDEKIVENFQKVRNFNASYGTVTANQQENALKGFMKDLGIKDEVVTKAMGGIRRLDLANIALHTNPQTTLVSIQGANDKLAQEYGANQDLPADKITKVGENGIIISPLNPQEVWNPRLKLTENDQKRELFIRTGADIILQKEQEKIDKVFAPREEESNAKNALRRFLRDKLREKRAEEINKKMELDLKDQPLETNPHQDLSQARFNSSKIHNPPHFTGKVVVEDSQNNRDPNMVFKLVHAMMKAKDGSEFLKRAEELSTSRANPDHIESPTLSRRFAERLKRVADGSNSR
ncbi:MAG: hypothetical protein ACO201_04300 [Rickettsiales bacterium]